MRKLEATSTADRFLQVYLSQFKIAWYRPGIPHDGE
jgi:hypothetical protein